MPYGASYRKESITIGVKRHVSQDASKVKLGYQ